MTIITRSKGRDNALSAPPVGKPEDVKPALLPELHRATDLKRSPLGSPPEDDSQQSIRPNSTLKKVKVQKRNGDRAEDVKPKLKSNASAADEHLGPALHEPPHEEKSGEDEDGGPGPEKAVVPPSGVRGRQVKWDRHVRTILTTDAKAMYKISDAYLYSLDFQTGQSRRRRIQWYAYAECEVQQAAYNQRGGRAFFEAYLQRLHETKVTKAKNKGWSIGPLNTLSPPFITVPYEVDGTPGTWVDQTRAL